jgi:hypothetical protein
MEKERVNHKEGLVEVRDNKLPITGVGCFYVVQINEVFW